MRSRPNTMILVFFRHFCSAAKLPKLPKLTKIPTKYRPKAIAEAQKALTEYLHTTRCLPFTYAEHIGRNSLFSLSEIISKVEYSSPRFAKSFQRFLRYHPINEFEFFYESIGLDRREIVEFLPSNKFFIEQEQSALNAACVLSEFGFPWTRLGLLYKVEISIFGKSPEELNCRLKGLKENYGFDNFLVVGICLVFPHVLGCRNGETSDALLDDLKRVFLDFGLQDEMEGNVDACYEVCRKIRFFYDMGCKEGEIGELLGRGKHIFLEYPEEVLVQKADFFCRLSVERQDVGLLLLRYPEILNFDLENPTISVSGFLQHFGLGAKKKNSLAEKYPYVFGRNKFCNLPYVMRALDLHEWFFNRIRNGNQHLLGSYAMSSPDEDLDYHFRDTLGKIQGTRTPYHTLNKLKFLHDIGFGENRHTMEVLPHLHGTQSELQMRFDCLIRAGIEFSKLCKMISLTTKILNQHPDILEKKVNFLLEDMGLTVLYLDAFPAYLCYNLENRIKPRFEFHLWLTEKGLCMKDYSLASIIATSDKNFIRRLYSIHVAAPKQWTFNLWQESQEACNFYTSIRLGTWLDLYVSSTLYPQCLFVHKFLTECLPIGFACLNMEVESPEMFRLIIDGILEDILILKVFSLVSSVKSDIGEKIICRESTHALARTRHFDFAVISLNVLHEMGREACGVCTTNTLNQPKHVQPEEDEVLINHVKKYGPRDWSSIRSKGLLQRTGKSCRLRWVNKLRPNLKNGCKFSLEEERIVIDLQALFGNKWARIATYLPGRTDNDVKNFWSSRQKRLARILKSPSKSQHHHDTGNRNGKQPLAQHDSPLPAENLCSQMEVGSLIMAQPCSSSYMESSEMVKMFGLPELVTTDTIKFDATIAQLEFSIKAENSSMDMESESQNPFPQLPQLEPDLALSPESQELIARLEDPSFMEVFGQRDLPELGTGENLSVDLPMPGIQESYATDGTKESVDTVTPDTFFDDFPTDMFDHIESLPSPSDW
ncbi:Transcription termination factor, mitochondrial/chloroplastic [Dillenia turbinata]|uniref:Transcription termination factor, mitochondrial/chloroplastic n=1 Tax=Dillenia turbinata TaxID=194707 RepID=A0AAN8Z2T7_9MAGN